MIIKATSSDIEDGTMGACVSCGEFQDGCEPDARKYTCESCGKATVYGLEELLIMGNLELSDEEYDDE